MMVGLGLKGVFFQMKLFYVHHNHFLTTDVKEISDPLGISLPKLHPLDLSQPCIIFCTNNGLDFSTPAEAAFISSAAP